MYRPDTFYSEPQPQPLSSSLARLSYDSEYRLQQHLLHQEQQSNLPFHVHHHHHHHNHPRTDASHFSPTLHPLSPTHHPYHPQYFEEDYQEREDNSYFLYSSNTSHPHLHPLTPSSLPLTSAFTIRANDDTNDNFSHNDSRHFRHQSGFTLSIPPKVSNKQQQQQQLHHIQTSTATSDPFRALTPESEILAITTTSPTTKTSPASSNAAHLGGNFDDGDDDMHRQPRHQHGRHASQGGSERGLATGRVSLESSSEPILISATSDFIVRALHEYHTDSEGHLSFERFQYIKVKHCEPSGWWLGESDCSRGWFPSNRVERVAEEYEAEYLSRPTSITSEDYDQIRTGLDGVETQFLGEPVHETISESLRIRGHLAFPSSILGHLSVLPGEKTVYGSEASTEMESDYFYQQGATSQTSLSNITTTTGNTNSMVINDVSVAYSDFVAEIALYVKELREATTRGDVARYQPIVANIISCVKALLVFTNTITRESEVLTTYPELAKSRRVILRALGKLYSKCRVANGSQALTTMRQRQFAVEKLSMFASQILGGITDFTTKAREIGLQFQEYRGGSGRRHSRSSRTSRTSSIMDESFASLSGSARASRARSMELSSSAEQDLAFIAAVEARTHVATPTLVASNSGGHGRTIPRRKVSRANSSKGFKSFNAVRNIKAEHTQKFNAAKRAIESLFVEYMESLKGKLRPLGMAHILRKSVESARVVEVFLASAMDIKARTHVKEDEEYTQLKNDLSAALDEFFEYVHKLETAPLTQERSLESIMTVLMTLTSALLKRLVDLDVQSKRNSQARLSQQQQMQQMQQLQQLQQQQQEQQLHQQHQQQLQQQQQQQQQLLLQQQQEQQEQQQRQQQQQLQGQQQDEEVRSRSSKEISNNNVPSPTETVSSPLPRPSSKDSDNLLDALLSSQPIEISPAMARTIAARNTAPVPARAKAVSGGVIVGGNVPLNRKFASLNAISSDRYKRQGPGQPSNEKDHLNPDAAYGEAHDLEKSNNDHRSNHDSAVIMSGQNTPHHSMFGGRKMTPEELPMKEEYREGGIAEEEEDDLSAQGPPTLEGQGHADQTFKSDVQVSASRMVQTVFVAPQASRLIEEPVAHLVLEEETSPVPANARDDVPPLKSARSPRMPPVESARRAVKDKPMPEESLPSSRLTTGRYAPNARQTPTSPRLTGKSSFTSDIGMGLGPGTTNIPSRLPSSSASSGAPTYGGSIPRAPNPKRVRSPIPPSPRLESTSTSSTTRRVPKPEASPHLEPISTMGGQDKPSTRAAARRESRDYNAQEQPRPSFSSSHSSSSTTPFGPPRRNSRRISVNPVRSEPIGQRGDEDDQILGLTPPTPHVQTFNSNDPSSQAPRNQQQGAPRRPGKSQQRISMQSNLSVATESSQSSITAHNTRVNAGTLRPMSPGLPRGKASLDIGRRSMGRVSGESTRTIEREYQQQQAQQPHQPSGPRTSPIPGYRRNRVGLTKGAQQGQPTMASSSITTPWFMEEDYEADEVLYNDNQQLVGATLEAFIEILTSHKDAPEAAFVSTFFTTFRLFTNPVELTGLLVQRFMQQPPTGLAEHERVMWIQHKQERVQKRVHLAFKTWLESYWVSERDRAAFTPIMEFVTQELMEALPGPAGRMLDMLNQWVNKRHSLNLSGRGLAKSRSHERLHQGAQEGSISGSSASSSNKYGTVKEKQQDASSLSKGGRRGLLSNGRDSTNNRGPPVPLVNKALLNALSNDHTMTKVPVTDIKPIELARQLTIMVGKLYNEIPYLELLGKERPNCSRMIQVSNKITIWVTDTIVDEQDVKKRIGVVKHWIEVGEECLKLNNFDTLTAISCAIESTPVKRLYNTWEGISKSYVERSNQLRKTISSDLNYRDYRAKLKTVQAPCIPFLGLYLTVIAYIEDGNSTYKELNPVVPPTPGINTPTTPMPQTSSETTLTRKLLRYGRFFQLTKAVQEFRDFQGTYELLEVPRLRDYILKCMENQDSERNYRKSLAIEPRRPSGGVGAGNVGHRSSGGGGANGGNKGLFHGGISHTEVNGGSGVKSNKLSFFNRKSGRSG